MPLPLPDLDDRRWADLVDEARALIPQLAPAWTDLNYSDPGVTLIDLLAYLTEAGVFALDRIPATHRARFLELAGVRQRPYRPAVTPVRFASRSGTVASLPVGALLASSSGGRSWPHRLTTDDGGADPAVALTVWGCGLGGVQTWTGDGFLDRTADVSHRGAFDAVGANPGSQAAGNEAALLLGFGLQPAFPPDARLSLWLSLDDAATAGLSGTEPEVAPGTPHPGFATAWECFDGTGWQPLDGVLDETRALTRSGRVVLPIGVADPPPAVVGVANEPFRWVRVRAASGRPDVPPRVLGLDADATAATQSVPIDGVVATADGGPSFTAVAEGAPFAGDSIAVSTLDDAGTQPWQVVDTLLRSTPEDFHVLADPGSGRITFGDGEYGRYPARDAAVRVAAVRTLGAAGTPTALATWAVDAATPHAADLAVTAVRPLLAGSDREELAAAEGRAAERVWVHERLLELAPAATTLDQADRALVAARPRPPRATTLVDYERIALEVPGTAILRARAFAEVDPAGSGLVAEGTVTVVVVPGLPAGRPRPTPATLGAIRRWLCERRTLGTRLVVTGPDYVEVTVRAVLQSLPGSDPDRVRTAALARLRGYLDPLDGGPVGRGWPFGRDLHRADLLAELDKVAGADHVLDLDLFVAGLDAGCGNVCLTPLQLVVSGAHEVEVR